jgi:hypothetical protein
MFSIYMAGHDYANVGRIFILYSTIELMSNIRFFLKLIGKG